MGKGKLVIGPIFSSQAGPTSAAKKKAPTKPTPKKKRKASVKKENTNTPKKTTDTKEKGSRTVGTPKKAFRHWDNWETNKDYALNAFNTFTFHDAVVNFEVIKDDNKMKDYVGKWLKTKYEDIDSAGFFNKIIWEFLSSFLMRLYTIHLGRDNAGS